MAQKDKRGATGPQPVLKVVGSPAEVRAQAQATQSGASSGGEGIFSDKRSGRDRREDSAPVNDPRRQNPERRKGKAQASWWLERDYVESHHFVQKSTSPRTHPPDDPSTAD